jgi:hypothetical protein
MGWKKNDNVAGSYGTEVDVKEILLTITEKDILRGNIFKS